MIAAAIASVALSLTVAAAASPTPRPESPPYMVPPAGWHSLGQPPPNAPVDYGWVSAHSGDGTPHAGDSMVAWVRPIPADSTLADQVREVTTAETQDGRTLTSSQSHATCNGTQPSWTIDFRFVLSPSVTVSQVYQIAVFEGHVYVIIFTHRADLPVDSVVQASLDSLCPKNGN